MDENGYYVKNKDLIVEVIKFKEDGVASEELGQMLIAIATKLSTKGNFSNYTWRQDMISEAVLTCIKYLKNFNPEKSQNPFAYITQICKNSFKAYIKSQNKHSVIKDSCYKYYEILVDGEQGLSMAGSCDYSIMQVKK